jgi:hypothetical protein
MSGPTSSSYQQPTLSPLPPPPPRSRKGYLWTLWLVTAIWVGVLALVGFGFFTLPGVDPVRAGGWYFAISLMLITPAAVVVLVLSCGVVAILRRLGARTWPGVLQAAPSVALVLTLLYVLDRWLFTGQTEE